jgi:hypothetical protein
MSRKTTVKTVVNEALAVPGSHTNFLQVGVFYPYKVFAMLGAL